MAPHEVCAVKTAHVGVPVQQGRPLLGYRQEIVDGMGVIAVEADAAYGYDGIKRDTYKLANSPKLAKAYHYPFKTRNQLVHWIVAIRR